MWIHGQIKLSESESINGWNLFLRPILGKTCKQYIQDKNSTGTAWELSDTDTYGKHGNQHIHLPRAPNKYNM